MGEDHRHSTGSLALQGDDGVEARSLVRGLEPEKDADGRMSDLQRPWMRIRDRAGLRDMRLHDCRHSFASRALALGESLPAIGRLLGHSQVQTTARYAHLARDSVHEVAERISDRIERALFGDCPQYEEAG